MHCLHMVEFIRLLIMVAALPDRPGIYTKLTKKVIHALKLPLPKSRFHLHGNRVILLSGIHILINGLFPLRYQIVLVWTFRFYVVTILFFFIWKLCFILVKLMSS